MWIIYHIKKFRRKKIYTHNYFSEYNNLKKFNANAIHYKNSWQNKNKRE